MSYKVINTLLEFISALKDEGVEAPISIKIDKKTLDYLGCVVAKEEPTHVKIIQDNFGNRVEIFGITFELESREMQVLKEVQVAIMEGKLQPTNKVCYQTKNLVDKIITNKR